MTHASLFTGIGGFDLVAEWMGWENIFQVEIDQFCQKLLAKNFPNTVKYGDIKEFDGSEYRGTIDVLSGGFPCQDISAAGKGLGITGNKSGLWFEFYRCIQKVYPSYIVIENSPLLLKRGFECILHGLSKIGYNVEWECFSASDTGLPHKRERLFIVAYAQASGWKGILHGIKRSVHEKKGPYKTLDSYSNPFLQFEQERGESPVFGMANGLPKRLDVVNRLGAIGNAVVPQVVYQIFKAIHDHEAALLQP